MARKSVTHSEAWWTTAPAHIVRCTARYKTTGEPCRSEARAGATVCDKHGGLAPQVQAAAATRIQMSAEDIVKRLAGMLDDPQVEPREKVKIMQDWLDRAGLGAASKHLVGVVADDPVESLFRDLLSRPGALADPAAVQVASLPELDAAQAAIDAAEGDDDYLWQDVVDAELVEVAPAPLPPPQDDRPARNPANPPKHIREALERLL